MERESLKELGHKLTSTDAYFAGTAHSGKYLSMLHTGALLYSIGKISFATIDDLLPLIDEVFSIFYGPFIWTYRTEHFQTARQRQVDLFQLIAFLAEAFYFLTDEFCSVDHAFTQLVLDVHEAVFAQVGFLKSPP